jgi:hypothetical protein
MRADSVDDRRGRVFGARKSCYTRMFFLHKGTAQAHRFSRHPAEMIISLATYKGQAPTYDKACRLSLSQNFSDGLNGALFIS